MKRIEYETGQKIGNCIYLHDVAPSSRRKALFDCECGTKFEAEISNVSRGITASCGCIQKRRSSENLTKHGLCGTKAHVAWCGIKHRCYFVDDISFKNYGARGIRLYGPWITDFKLFYNYVKDLPHYDEKGYSIDRIKNDGNYEPGNLRWSNRSTQNSNRRKNHNNKSGYTGIGLTKNNKYYSEIGDNYLGVFKNIEEAVEARNNYILENKLTEYRIQELNKY